MLLFPLLFVLCPYLHPFEHSIHVLKHTPDANTMSLQKTGSKSMSKRQRDRQWQIKLQTVVVCALMSISAANQTDTIMEHYRPPCECKNWTDSEEDWWWFSPTMMAAAKNHCALPASDPTLIPFFNPKLTFSRSSLHSSSRLFHTCLHSQPPSPHSP